MEKENELAEKIVKNILGKEVEEDFED